MRIIFYYRKGRMDGEGRLRKGVEEEWRQFLCNYVELDLINFRLRILSMPAARSFNVLRIVKGSAS